jgi:hypothetical protein
MISLFIMCALIIIWVIIRFPRSRFTLLILRFPRSLIHLLVWLLIHSLLINKRVPYRYPQVVASSLIIVRVRFPDFIMMFLHTYSRILLVIILLLVLIMRFLRTHSRIFLVKVLLFTISSVHLGITEVDLSVFPQFSVFLLQFFIYLLHILIIMADLLYHLLQFIDFRIIFVQYFVHLSLFPHQSILYIILNLK